MIDCGEPLKGKKDKDLLNLNEKKLYNVRHENSNTINSTLEQKKCIKTAFIKT